MKIGIYQGAVHLLSNKEEAAHLGMEFRNGVTNYVFIGGNWNNVIFVKKVSPAEYAKFSVKRASGYYKVAVVSASGRTVKFQPSKRYLNIPDEYTTPTTIDVVCELRVQDDINCLVIDPNAVPKIAQPVVLPVNSARQAELLSEPEPAWKPEDIAVAVAETITPAQAAIEKPLEERLAHIADSLRFVPEQPKQQVTLQRVKDHSTLKQYGADLNALLAKLPILYVGFDSDNKLQLEKEEEYYAPI